MTIREVTVEDYGKVLAIRDPSEVYGGRDYLPDYFKLFVNTMEYTGYMVEMEGKLIAFQFGVLLDGGKTLCTTAGRVSKDWEGRGIFKMLTQHVIRDFVTTYGVTRKVLAFDNINEKMEFEQLTDLKFKIERMNIRKVTGEDYYKVLAIRDSSEVYGGRDYLPDYFKLFINTREYTGYVVEMEDKLIAVQFAVVLNGGKTLGTKAGRVSKDWEGRGVFKMLTQHVIREFVKTYGVTRKVLAFDNNNEKMVIQMIEGNCKMISKRKVKSYRSVIGDIKLKKDDTSDLKCIKELDREDIRKIFSSNNDTSHLFPDDIVTVYWLPYRLLDFNIPLIFAGNCVSLGSGIPCIGQTYDTGPLLTFGQYYNSSLCFMFQLDVYGKDFTKLSDHLGHHLNKIKHIDPDRDIELMIYVEKDCDVGIIDGILKDFSFSGIITNIVTQYSAEIDIV